MSAPSHPRPRPRALAGASALAVAGLALAAPPLRAQAPLAPTALDFSGMGSVWGAGAPTSYTATTNWGKSYGVSKSVDGGSGFTWALRGSADASFNFASSAQVTGGALAAGFRGSAQLDVNARPAIAVGDDIRLGTHIGGAETRLATSDADFGMRTVFSGSFDAEAKAKGCVPVLGCESKTKSVDVSVSNRDLLSLNWGGDGKVKFGGATISGVQYGRPVAVPGGAAAIVAQEPQIDGQSATGGKRATTLFEDRSLLHVALDPVKVALGLARKGVPCLTDCSFKIPVIDKHFDWTLFDVDTFLDVGLRQSIDLVMHPFTVFDFGAPVTFRAGGAGWTTGTSVRVDGWDADLRFRFPSVDGLRVTTRYGMTGTVTNRTYMTFAGSGDIEALEARLDGHGFGPLLDQDIPGVSSAVKLFDASFDMDLGMRAGSEVFLALAPVPPPPPPPSDPDPTPDPLPPENEDPTPPPENTVPSAPEPQVEVTATPEPSTVVLLAAGLATLAVGGRRRRTGVRRAGAR